MIYTIEETNLERQHLLAQFLNPITQHALQSVFLPQNANILDVGCGLGDTTLMLHDRFPGSTITGLDGDAVLIEAALAEKKIIHPNLDFVCADALHIPFDNNSFDFVFTRACLHHLQSAIGGLREMTRVCRPGGIVFAHEPDINNIISYPESWACQRHREYLNRLFEDALVGRKLISYFRQLQFKNITHYVGSVIGDETNNIKRFVTLTAAAIGNALVGNKLAIKEEHEALVKELQRVQYDSETIVLMPPSITVWGVKVL